MRKQIFVNLIFVFLLSSNLFSQECQIIRDDSNGVTTRIFEDDSRLKYFTHELLVRLDTLRRDDPEYMQQVNNFIISLNCKIIRVYEDTPPLNTLKGYVYLGLADSMDAFNYIEIFTQSGLFLDVGLNAAGKLNDIFFKPNDPKFNEQWYLPLPQRPRKIAERHCGNEELCTVKEDVACEIGWVDVLIYALATSWSHDKAPETQPRIKILNLIVPDFRQFQTKIF
jgi:hypothetical protein